MMTALIACQAHEGYDVHPSSGMFQQQLSTRRELVEQLDSEPLFDYLIQNGVLEEPLVNQIRNESSPAKANLALLHHLEENGKTARKLFINALRQTGQLHLANLLDEERKIKGLSGSGYLSKKRHKGQVSLHIYTKALRLPQDLIQIHTTREWMSLDDILLALNLQKTQRPSMQQMELIEGNEEENEKQSSCFCMCFMKMFSKKKTKKSLYQNQTESSRPVSGDISLTNLQQPQPQPQPCTSPEMNGSSGNNLSKQNKYRISESDLNKNCNGERRITSTDLSKMDIESLNNVAALIQQKSEELYEVLKDTSSATYTQLLKYFEQDRGVLVLETACEDGLVIVSICMHMEQLDQLRRDLSSGKLNKDLENCVVTEEVLQKTGIRGVKLRTEINLEEFDLAEQELI